MILTTSPIAARSTRTKTADKIAKVVIDNWESYGRLPSIAVGQAFVESGLGSGGSNIFGVNGCRGLGIESATIGYLKCLSNEYFKGQGAFSLDREYQLSVIMIISIPP